MKRNSWCLLVCLLATCFAGRVEAAANPTTTVRIGGTGFALPVMKVLATSFAKSHPGVHIQIVPSLGSAGGIKALLEGALDIALSGRPLNEAEKKPGMVARETARTPLAFITHGKVRKTGVVTGELEKIYGGQTSTWPDGTRIRPVLRPLSETDTQILRSISPLLGSAVPAANSRDGMIIAVTDQENLATVARTPGALGMCTLAQILPEKQPVTVLTFNGIMPNVNNLRNNSYPLYKSLYLVTTAGTTPEARQFAAYVQSKSAGSLLASYGTLVIERTNSK